MSVQGEAYGHGEARAHGKARTHGVAEVGVTARDFGEGLARS
ncbi:hypothetical protein [Streptomyces sp. RK9]